MYYNICSYIVLYVSGVYTSFECGCLEYPATTLGGGGGVEKIPNLRTRIKRVLRYT